MSQESTAAPVGAVEPAAPAESAVPEEHQHGHLSRLLYVSHTLSTWNTRVFQFGSVLFLADLYPGTLFPVSVYALCTVAPGAFLSPLIGRYIDNTERLVVGRSSIVYQRLAVITSCLLFLFPPVRDYRLLIVFAFLGGVENVWSIVNTVAIERDWVVVIANGDKPFLRDLNARMRFIDLFCKLMGPFVIGMLDSISARIAIYTTLGLSVLSVTAEYFTLAKVYYSMPALAKTKARPAQVIDESGEIITVKSSYWKNPVLLPSLSLCLLYITVLSFSGQMISFLLASGLTPATITVFRTVSVVVELSATFLVPWVMSEIGPLRTGLGFLDLQALVLAITTAVFFVIEPSLGAFALSIGATISRLGLWGFDLSAQVIIQEGVAEHERGSFSATEKALQNLCSMLVYLSTMVFSKPSQFKWPVLMSSIAVIGAATLFTTYYFKQRRTGEIHLS